MNLSGQMKKSKESEKRVVIIPYAPRPLWKDIIHPNLDIFRFSVIVAHRRFGKTVGVINHVIKKAIKNKKLAPQYAYVAPYRYQAKRIAWIYLKYYTSTIPGIKENESDLFIEFPSLHPDKNVPGARIYVIGADHPDGLRGTYWDGIILDEYAQIKKELWGEVIRPSLADRKGWAVFIGTPKGQNQFFEVYQKACGDPEWYVCLYRVDESGVIDQEELESMKKDMTDTEIRQELYCDFTASAYNILITIDLASAAAARIKTENELEGAEKVIGVDVARFGDDRSVIQKRIGYYAYPAMVFQGLNNMDLADRVALVIEEFQPDAVLIDAGRGEGVIDRLRQMGYDIIIEVPFGGKAVKDNRYVNRRTEMWDNVRQWLEEGGAIPNDSDLKTDLTTPEYSFDAANRMKLEPKEKIKERIGKSTDKGDALALTLSVKVLPGGLRRRQLSNQQPLVANTKYDPLQQRRVS